MPDERDSPSAGWRAVYAAMDVSTSAEESPPTIPDERVPRWPADGDAGDEPGADAGDEPGADADDESPVAVDRSDDDSIVVRRHPVEQT